MRPWVWFLGIVIILVILSFVDSVSVFQVYRVAIILGIAACFYKPLSYPLEGRIIHFVASRGWEPIFKQIGKGLLVLLAIAAIVTIFYALSYSQNIFLLILAFGIGIMLISAFITFVIAFWYVVLIGFILLVFTPFVFVPIAIFFVPIVLLTVTRMVLLYLSANPLKKVIREHARLTADQFHATLLAAVQTVKHKNPHSQLKMHYETELANKIAQLSAAKRQMFHEAMMQMQFEDAYLDMKDFIPEYKASGAGSQL
ncbi:MAG: hypothetical protein KC422_24550 [Trueperaceae bacterium]|nr:hypothetical protein [Trueperaceae bacterium]